MSTTLDRLIPLVRHHTSQDKDVSAQSRLVDDLGLDSLDRIDLGCNVLEAFDVHLPDDILFSAETVSDLVKLIDAALAALPVRGMA